MRKLCLLLLVFCFTQVQAQDLAYYLPKNVSYNPSIPTPKSLIYHEVGEWHVTHDRLVNYMKAVDAASDRIVLQQTGFSYEGRPQLVLIITSIENHKKLETIRQEHLKLSDPKQAANVITDNMPAVLWMGYSIHGNESSGANASLLAAYYLAAAQGPEVDKLLENTVILLDPSFNPDGLNRFASWANMHKSKTMVADPNAREFNEVWPSGRFNHYWFDLNRDWLPAQHVESQNRLTVFQNWKPNVLTDHHEMGSNASFFFQPGVPSRVNPNTPEKNQQLTGAIGNFHAKFLDSIGSLYFTKEGYDDFYYGKGSTYPDINGGIGILFEQASSRGHAQETENGLLTFPFTIRNQFTTTLSTLEAVKNLRKDLLNWQREFYVQAAKDAAASPVKAYVFGDKTDLAKTNRFVDMLLRHKIEIFNVKKSAELGGQKFEAGKAFVIPFEQHQSKLIKAVFEKTFDYKDSLFYDVTAWTMPLAFGLPYAELTTVPADVMGNRVMQTTKPEGGIKGGMSNYAYVFGWERLNAPALLYQLQQRGINAKVATQPLNGVTNEGNKSFAYGAILIHAKQQSKPADELYRIINEAATTAGVEVYSMQSGLSAKGIDLGSGSFVPVKKPSIMMFGGSGTSATDVGEIWHLLDQKFSVPVSIVDVERFNAINPSRYNVIIMPSGSYNTLDKNAQDKLKTWISGGGTLVATEDAVKYLSNNGFTKVLFKEDNAKRDSTQQLPYYLRSDEQRAKDMTGSLFEAKMDLTHPLCYGYTTTSVSIFKSNNMFMDQNNNPYDSPVMYTANPLQSGYLYRGYKDLIKNTAVVNIDQLGRGRIISQVDNLNFRAFWYGTSKLFMNAIFFGDIVRF
jgi:hypothetical protein